MLSGKETELASGSITGDREWTLLALATLTAVGGTTDELLRCVRAALHHGAIEDEILDAVNHACRRAGTRRAADIARRIAEHLATPGLAGQPQGIGERVVRLADHATAVWDNGGPGVPVLLLHALAMDRRVWRSLYPVLATASRVVAYDLRGHGHAHGASPATSLRQLAEDARTLLDVLGIERADVYGQSLGGIVAQHLVLDHPDRVRSLGLIATATRAPGSALSRAESAERYGMRAQIPETLIRWFAPESIATNDWTVRYARECLRRACVPHWSAMWRALAEHDIRGRLGDIRTPSIVIAGQQDPSATPESMREAARDLPDAEYRLLDPGSHMMVLEQPAALGTELLAFRKRVDARERRP